MSISCLFQLYGITGVLPDHVSGSTNVFYPTRYIGLQMSDINYPSETIQNDAVAH
jgi:hypothetical protein